jgi:hypothetical protein
MRWIRQRPAARGWRAFGVAFALSLAGCGGAPRSKFPDAAAAIARMRATHACSLGLVGEAKADFMDSRGRVRGNVSILAALPDRTRLDVFSPFGVSLSTLTTDQGQFAFFDLEQKSYIEGPASPCNIARFTQVPMPPFALVQLLRGEAPVLKHASGQTNLAWSSGFFGGGRYRVEVRGQHESVETIEMVPHPDDFDRPWQQQRVRVLRVALEQQGIALYQAELEGHRPTETARTRQDPDGIDPDIPPSGPACSAEVPRRLRLVVPDGSRDLVIHFERVEHNPPLVAGAFHQVRPDGARFSRAQCR